MVKLLVRVTFLDPFRIVPWREELKRRKDRRYLRGGTFARWHKIDDEHGRPYLTGTLLRSALLAELEKIIILRNNPFNCCSGEDKTDPTIKKPFLRKRLRYVFDAELCGRENPCPLCLIKGSHDAVRREDKIDENDTRNTRAWSVHFSNLWENSDREFNWEDTVSERVANRVDPASGKGKDYFRIWEIAPSVCSELIGSITINTDDAEKIQQIKMLVAAGLSHVNILAGAVCRIDIVSEDHQSLIREFIKVADEEDEGYDEPESNDAEPVPTDAMGDIEAIARKISDLLGGKENLQLLRRLADVIRELRVRSPEAVKSLPADKKGGRPSLWDRSPRKGNQTLREILRTEANRVKEPRWRQFCEELGEALYQLYGDSQPHARALPRILGETEYYGRAGGEDRDCPEAVLRGKDIPSNKWVITGQMAAVTPFFFGAESEKKQTGNTIILSRDGSFRMPRSVIRGALRRDLRLVIDDGCDMPIGGRPCDCAVCRIMRHIVVEGAASSYRRPPEIRYGIRLNQHAAVVEEGALFDKELGYQGLIFPFRLHFETVSSQMDPYLYEVLNNWKEGMAVLGGDIGSGMGRFRLGSLKVFCWNISDEKTHKSYLLLRGLGGLKDKDTREIEEMAPLSSEWDPRIRQKPVIEPCQLPWEKVEYEIEVHAPLISRDPIAAMLDQRGVDAVTVRKGVLSPDGKGGNLLEPEYRYFIKGGSIRGIIRSIVMSNEKLWNRDHEDCDCPLCRLFGSVHQEGRLRFEDAEVQGSIADQKMDHVAIDRFTGGGVEQMKFDDYPLSGSPDRPLTLKGILWVKSDVKDIDIDTGRTLGDALREAFADFRDGLSPLGGLGAIGYGRIGRFEIVNTTEPGWLQLPERKWNCERCDVRSLKDLDVSLDIKPDVIYFPHYFLKPSENPVRRETRLISHVIDKDAKGNELFTGRIRCRLRTQGPIFIPDTQEEDYFAMQEKYGKHKNYGFFRINDRIAIPGSSLRGTISSVYEALTNSCFRVFDQHKYISRSAEPGTFNNYLPGKVKRGRDGNLVIQEMLGILRLPLYDNSTVTKGISFKKTGDVSRDRKIEAAIKFNNEIAELAEHNLKFLKDRYFDDELKQILRGEAVVWFSEEHPNKEYKKDIAARLVPSGTPGAKSGFVKFSGPSMVNVNKTGSKNHGFNEQWDVSEDWWNASAKWELDRLPLHNDKGEWESQKNKYPRPLLACVRDSVEYKMVKRCETVFIKPEGKPAEYTIPEKVRRQYNEILKDNRNNTEKILPVFRSRTVNAQLSEGDLVFFNLKEGCVNDVIPVRVSRTIDKRPMGKRFPDGNESLRPCHHVCIEDCEDCSEICDRVNHYFSPHPGGLCPGCHLFGTPFYKGRVNFGIAWLENITPRWYVEGKMEDPLKGGSLTLPLLERPRPTWSMPEDDANIPGRKFFIHHPWSVDKIRDNQFDAKGADPSRPDLIRPNENNRTVELLGKGNEFCFEIGFNNLRDWELGLLLYSLELEDDLAHKLGMAKAQGAGSVRIVVEELLLRNKRTEDLHKQTNKTTLMETGFEHLGIDKLNAGNFRAFPHIAQLRELLWLPPEGVRANVRYPTLKRDDAGVPGYLNLNKFSEEHLGILQTPWKLWYPEKEYPNRLSTEDEVTSVRSSKARQPVQKNNRSKTGDIYVGNLPFTVSESDVRNLFAGHGAVHSVRLMIDYKTGRSRGFGFVTLEGNMVDKVIEDLSGIQLGGRTLIINRALGKKTR